MSSGIQSHWSWSSRTVAQHCIFARWVRVTINQTSINDLPREEKSVHNSLFSPLYMQYMSINISLPAFMCVWTTLQSGCLFLAARCGLINVDRLPLRPTTNTSTKETRQESLPTPWLIPDQILVILTMNPLKLNYNPCIDDFNCQTAWIRISSFYEASRKRDTVMPC